MYSSYAMLNLITSLAYSYSSIALDQCFVNDVACGWRGILLLTFHGASIFYTAASDRSRDFYSCRAVFPQRIAFTSVVGFRQDESTSLLSFSGRYSDRIQNPDISIVLSWILALLKSKRCLGDPCSAVLQDSLRLCTESLQYDLDTASATLSLNVQSFQTTTFNGDRHIYGTYPLLPWHPSRRPLVRSSCSLCASVSLFADLRHCCPKLKLTLQKALESENWLVEIKTILWMCDGLGNFICWRLTRSNHCNVSKMMIYFEFLRRCNYSDKIKLFFRARIIP